MTIERVAVIFDEPDSWKILAVWDLSIKAGPCKVADAVHAARLQNLTGLAESDCRRWAMILFSAQIALANGEVIPEAMAFVRAKMRIAQGETE